MVLAPNRAMVLPVQGCKPRVPGASGQGTSWGEGTPQRALAGRGVQGGAPDLVCGGLVRMQAPGFRGPAAEDLPGGKDHRGERWGRPIQGCRGVPARSCQFISKLGVMKAGMSPPVRMAGALVWLAGGCKGGGGSSRRVGCSLAALHPLHPYTL